MRGGTRYLIFDTETTGLPLYPGAPYADLHAWPRLVQVGWVVCSASGEQIAGESLIIRPEGFAIPAGAEKVHGISTRSAEATGVPVADALRRFQEECARSDAVVAHNLAFDEGVITSECLRLEMDPPFLDLIRICTMEVAAPVCRLRRPGGWKYPTLTEVHGFLFGAGYEGCHDALHDAKATARCFFELVDRGCIVMDDGEGREAE
ncbi:hypothetical protein RJ53_08985 [Methanocalculus chunghsingensis]|uniref:Exonuclease domain-containing protein n=1 Tax=Methanocalculus chunghsingensis TaxID=156457 RepID=A0A8J8B610_9EURY|nr:hypothetical protein [Methanocalculus chunghsingensis]